MSIGTAMTAARHIRRLLQSTGAPVEVLEGLSKVERHFLQTIVATLKKQPSIQQFFKSGRNPESSSSKICFKGNLFLI